MPHLITSSPSGSQAASGASKATGKSREQLRTAPHVVLCSLPRPQLQHLVLQCCSARRPRPPAAHGNGHQSCAPAAEPQFVILSRQAAKNILHCWPIMPPKAQCLYSRVRHDICRRPSKLTNSWFQARSWFYRSTAGQRCGVQYLVSQIRSVCHPEFRGPPRKVLQQSSAQIPPRHGFAGT